MIKKYFALSCLFALLMASCAKDDVLNTNSSEVQITTLIENDHSLSRADIDIDGKGNFTENDIITLKYGYNQKDLTLKDGQWTPSILWSELEGQTSISAFYPTVPSGKFTHKVLTNQHEGNNFEKSDLLYATKVNAEEGKPVNLNFKHLMSCLTVVIKAEGLTEEDMQKARLTVKAFSEVTVSADGSVGKAKLGNSVPINTMKYQGNHTFQVILCPQYTDIDYGYDGWLTIKVGNITHVVKEPPFKKLESGKNTTLRYTFSKNDPVVGGATRWVYGLDNIPPVEDPAWIPLDGPFLKQLIWSSGSDWYDCNKKNSSSPQFDDHRLCWAATASNMIHWWLDRNSDLLGDYCSTHNVPSAYPSHLESEVFQVFKDSFTDEGSFIEDGLNWYFLKKYTRRQNDAASLTNTKTGGYFKEVLEDVSNMTEIRGVSNVADLSSQLKYAFDNQKAIGFVIYLHGLNNGGRHAMTLWGAKFNSAGKVSEIYYCDNNDGGDVYSEKPHLIAAKVKDENGLRLQGSDKFGSFTMRIEQLILLDLKRTELKRYFNK